MHSHRIPHGTTGNPITQYGDPPGHLVPEHERMPEYRRTGEAVPGVRNVAPANPAPLHCDQHLTRPRGRIRPLFDADIPRAVHDNCLHQPSPPPAGIVAPFK